MQKKTVAVFDFDGTLTTRDTFIEFIKFSCGTISFYIGLFIYSPILILMKLHLYPNWKAKQIVFSHFFRRWEYSRFKLLGEQFVDKIAEIQNDKIILKLAEHINHGDTVLIVSASICEWIQPWAIKQNVTAVIATEIEVDNHGKLTGLFKTKNCYGKEKVRRLLELEPLRENYCLYAYGDSNGDMDLLAYADVGYRI